MLKNQFQTCKKYFSMRSYFFLSDLFYSSNLQIFKIEFNIIKSLFNYAMGSNFWKRFSFKMSLQYLLDKVDLKRNSLNWCFFFIQWFARPYHLAHQTQMMWDFVPKRRSTLMPLSPRFFLQNVASCCLCS